MTYGDVKTIQSSNAGGANLAYAYDVLNRLSTVTDANGTTNYGYDNVGNLQSVTYPNGVVHSYSYDTRNRLTTLGVAKGATQLAGYSYILDAAGHRLNVTELSGRVVNYSYDDLYRLTNETIAADPSGINGAVNYTYDPVGNRQQLTSTLAPVPAGLWNYDANDRLATVGEGYDNNGNTTASGGLGYIYDFENHLLKRSGLSIIYDGDGNRVSKTTGNGTTKYLVDDLNPTGYAQVLDELQSGAVKRTYSYGLELISEKQTIGSTLTTSYYVFDGHGSVRALTNSTGNVTDTYDYDAFGNLIHSTGSTPNLYLYSGEQFDPDLNLYYNRARYLNVSTGRFWTMDTFEGDAESPSSLHKYLYAYNDAISNLDRSGHGVEDALITAALYVGIGAAIGTGLGYYLTGTTKGAAFGALGGGLVGLTLAFGSPKQKVDVIVAGAANAAFQTLANYIVEYYAHAQNLPPPSQQTENELVVEAFAAGSLNALIGSSFGISPALSSFANSLVTAEFQGKSLKSALPSAIVGALIGYVGSGIQLPGGSDVDLYAVGKLITASVTKTISTASSPVLKETIRAVDSNLYNFLYGQ